MRTMLTIACVGALLWAATPAEAQLSPRRQSSSARDAKPTAPTPASPTKASERRTEASGQATDSSAHADAAGADEHGQSRFFRGSSWVGMTIWSDQNQQVGTVRDVLFDTTGHCLEDVVLESPTLGEQWVVVPYDVFRLSFDAQQHGGRLELSLPIERLHDAPRIEANRWEMLQSPQFYTQVQQFSQKITRTAARPTGEGTTDSERHTRQGGQGRMDRHDDAHKDAKQPANTERDQQPPAGTRRGNSKAGGAQGGQSPGSSQKPSTSDQRQDDQSPSGQSQGSQSHGTPPSQSDRSSGDQSSSGSGSSKR